MCLTNEGLSHQETSEMVRQVKLGRAIGEMYIAAQGNCKLASEKACEAMDADVGRYRQWRAFGFNQIMKKYKLKVRA